MPQAIGGIGAGSAPSRQTSTPQALGRKQFQCLRRLVALAREARRPDKLQRLKLLEGSNSNASDDWWHWRGKRAVQTNFNASSSWKEAIPTPQTIGGIGAGSAPSRQTSTPQALGRKQFQRL